MLWRESIVQIMYRDASGQRHSTRKTKAKPRMKISSCMIPTKKWNKYSLLFTFWSLRDLGDIRHTCIHPHCMACLKSPNLGAVYIIPEWLSFWNEFRSRVKFVRRCRLPYFRVRSDTHACSTRPRLGDEVRFQFTSWYQNEISYQKGPGI